MKDDEKTLVRALRAPAVKWADKLAAAFGSVGAIAPYSLTVATALGEATHTSALALLPTMLSGFFGVCSPRGAQTAEAQLGLLAEELAAVREQIDPTYFKREGALQLLRDFIPESARKDTDEDRARLRRVVVHAARLGISPDRSRIFFGLASRLSTEDIALLSRVARSREEQLEGADGCANNAELALRGEQTQRISWAVLEREGLLAREPSTGAPHVRALGMELLSWLEDDAPALPDARRIAIS